MAYDYYCTGCGDKLNNNIVLFDMQKLLTRDDRKFSILKFRITQAELLKLFGEGSGEWHHCELSLSNIAAYMANGHNLNDERIAQLTKQDIDSFISSQVKKASVAKTSASPVTGGAGFGAKFSTKGVKPIAPTTESAEVIIEEKHSDAIQALIEKDQAVNAEVLTKATVIDDLKILQSLIHGKNGEEKKIAIDLSINHIKDDLGNQLISGITIRLENGQVVPMDNNRVCPTCGRTIFNKAGSALHKSIVFIGYQESGKTSAILSMTHYAINHMSANLGDPIWQNAEVIDCIDEATQLDSCLALQTELSDYSEGIAPVKTTALEQNSSENDNAHGQAYSSTLFIKSHSGAKKVERIITLTDLPGELCIINGELKTNKILNDYKVAAACDALVVCFDTSRVEKAANGDEPITIYKDENGNEIKLGPGALISNTCSWADKFQSMLTNSGRQNGYVPTMLLFTKCRQLESPEAEIPITGNNIPLKKAYMFASEQKKIESNQIYNVVCDHFNESGALPNAYQAMLRCSPYGYKAPRRSDLVDDSKRLLQPPTPHNIDQLLKWILCVSGCIPVPAKYSITSVNTYPLPDYFIERTQHRSEMPQAGKGKDWEEAMARVCLFNNPGYFDQAFVKASGQTAVMIKVRFEAKLAKANANLGKE